MARDEAREVSLRLREMALKGSDDMTGKTIERHSVVFVTDMVRADYIPTVAPQAVLWAPHMFVFSGVTVAENNERFFQYLYYLGIEADEFVRTYQRKRFVQYAIFGWERANPRLTMNYRPIIEEELQIEARNYAEYVAHFDRARAAKRMLSYMILNAGEQLNFTHLDRWYIRDEGEPVGSDILYHLELRPWIRCSRVLHRAFRHGRKCESNITPGISGAYDPLITDPLIARPLQGVVGRRR